MKVSELILKLQVIQSEHGDLECRKYYSELDLYLNINDVEIIEDDDMNIVCIN